MSFFMPEIKIDTNKINASMAKVNEAMKNFLEDDPFSQIERIVKDIRDRKDNAMAMEFTKCIGELLKANGVVAKITEVKTGGTLDKDRNVIEERYGVIIDDLDFTAHDKVFEDKIAELERMRKSWMDKAIEWQQENERLNQYIAELESKETFDLPFDPLECANYLINATYERETNGIERAFHNLPNKVDSDRYTVDDLEQIAEHLLIYCKHNKESE